MDWSWMGSIYKHINNVCGLFLLQWRIHTMAHILRTSGCIWDWMIGQGTGTPVPLTLAIPQMIVNFPTMSSRLPLTTWRPFLTGFHLPAHICAGQSWPIARLKNLRFHVEHTPPTPTSIESQFTDGSTGVIELMLRPSHPAWSTTEPRAFDCQISPTSLIYG